VFLNGNLQYKQQTANSKQCASTTNILNTDVADRVRALDIVASQRRNVRKAAGVRGQLN